MTRLIYCLPILLALSVAPYRVPPPSMRMPPRETIYELAEAVTGAPAEILQGIAWAESSNRDDAVGDGGESIGRFQLREVYHGARSARWGEYDPRNPCEAAIIAGHVLMDNYNQLGDMDMAIAAYRQGVTGVRRDGATGWYVERVRRTR